MLMPETWLLLQSGPGPADANMAIDEALLESAAALGYPILRFYSWTEAAATFGYSQAYAEVARWTNLRPLIRRPTGGGLVPHDADWTYSLVFPPNHPWHSLKAVESYQRLHEWVRTAFEKLDLPTSLSACGQTGAPGQCFAGAEKFDLLANGRKIAGAAQRRNRRGLLIQGSVQPSAVRATRSDWESAMLKGPACLSEIAWTPFQLDARLQERVRELIEQKYGQPAYQERKSVGKFPHPN